MISIYNEYKSINVVFCINFPPTKSLVIYLSSTPKPRAASFRVLSSDLWPAATRLDPAASALSLRPSRQMRSRILSLSNNHIFMLHFEMIFWSILNWLFWDKSLSAWRPCCYSLLGDSGVWFTCLFTNSIRHPFAREKVWGKNSRYKTVHFKTFPGLFFRVMCLL